MEADPAWPAIVLAAVTAADGVACLGPVPYIRKALDRIDCPPGVVKALPWIKFASAAGLIAGLWIPGLGFLTAFCMTAYFAIAVGMHVRARDSVQNTVGAVVMLLFAVMVARTF
jgi:hypothetical protein